MKTSSKTYLITFLLLFLSISFHIITIPINSPILTAIALRVYYIPVLFGAMLGGVWLGSGSAIISVLVHYSLMYFSGDGAADHHAEAVMWEHLIEMPFLLVSGILVGFLRNYIFQEKTIRTKITNLFGQYVSEDVLSAILENKIDVSGEEFEATILFADIVSFTSFSENKSPSEVLKALNIYFSEIVNIITEHDGFVNKFIGDSLMAVFGIPKRNINHGKNAIHCALAIRKKLSEINTKYNNFDFDISIGINSGMVVAGNLGSDERLEYAVIGDVVNVASRIENLNRKYGTAILVSAETINFIKNNSNVKFIELDRVQVKGKKEKTTIYELIDETNQQNVDVYNQLKQSIEYYREKDWDRAREGFNNLLSVKEKIAKLYLDRIITLSKQENINWDGVHIYNEK